MRTLIQDVRFALRMLRKSPVFTAVAVLSVALGIGANTAVFSLANALLFGSLKVEDAARVVDVRGRANEDERFAASYPAYEHLRDHNDVLAGLLAWGELPLNLNEGGRAEQAFGMIVSANYFSVLGVRPERGRFFLPEEDKTPGAHPVAVLSYGAWQRRFGADANVVGKALKLNGQQFTVVGVAPKGFTSTFSFFAPDVWVPLMMQRQVLPTGDMLGANAEWLQMTGRLKDGVSAEQAAAQLSTLRAQYEDAHPELNRPGLGEPERPRGRTIELVPVGAFPRQVRGALYGFTALLLIIINLVFFIACANLTSLLLARAAARRREMAVRLTLGASRWRVVRQLLTESVLLCLVSGVVGTLLAMWMTDLLFAFKPSVRIPLQLSPQLDWRVLAWTLLLSLATGIFFGLAPALQATRTDLTRALKDEVGGRGARRSRLRDAFVAGQVAVSLLLLISAGLFLRALTYASAVHPGDDPERIQTVSFNPQVLGYTDERARDFYRRLLEGVRSSPGIESAGLALMVPVGESQAAVGIGVEGHESFDSPDINDEQSEKMIAADYNVISPGYFSTMRTPVLRGRDFDETDAARNVAIVDEAFTRRFFPEADPLGKHFKTGTTVFEIVGVAKSSAFRTKGKEPRPFIYVPFGRTGADAMFTQRMILHARGTEGVPAQNVYDAMRREASALDPDMPPEFAMSLADHISIALLPQRVFSSVAGVFGLLGLLLASVGIFGMVSYTVAQRTREIGIRMALGAQARDVFRLILRQGLKVALLGIGLGIAGALALTRLLTSLLYGVSAADPTVYVLTALLLVCIALLACYVPARRATKVDPMVALRYE